MIRKIFIAIPLFSLILLDGCGERVKPGVGEIKREQVSGVFFETITLSQSDEYYETSGTVQAKTVSSISSRIMGAVTSVRVKEGDRVRAGQLLLTIDDSDLVQRMNGASDARREAEQALEAAKENKNLSDITYERYKKLYEDRALTGQELDERGTQKRVADIDFERARAALNRAEAGMNEAKVYHGFTRITSPVTGVVTSKKIDPGSMAVPGSPLLTVEDTSSYRIEISVSEAMAARIRPGMKALVSIAGVEKEMEGVITEANPSIDPMSRSFTVKIALKGQGLKSGLYGKIRIPVGKKQALLVPAAAVAEKGELTGVYVVGRDSVIAYRLVRAGKKYGDKLEILSGLNPGERVITSGLEKAVDGGIITQR